MKRLEFTEDEVDVIRRLIFHYQRAGKSRHDVDLYASKNHGLANHARITLGVVYLKLDTAETIRRNTMGRPRTEPRA